MAGRCSGAKKAILNFLATDLKVAEIKGPKDFLVERSTCS